MILYYNRPDTKEEKADIYVDFHTLYNKVRNRYTESNLYRLLRKNCHPFRYQNRDLFVYEEILHIPELYSALMEFDLEKDES
jgi:hypothetical protein